MRVLVGTSGYSYKEWKGPFYPKDLAAGRFLPYYAERLPTVEINNTFYRMPTAKLVEGWAAEVPESFAMAVKAPQRITHIKKLLDAKDPTDVFVRTVSALGPRLGPLLFQLPPFLKKDAARLGAFLDAAPKGPRYAFEFRHASWFDDEVFTALRGHNASLCVADADPAEEGDKEALQVPFVATADWGYLRLRRAGYTAADLAGWAGRVTSQAWKDAFVFFKHEEAGAGPKLAAQFTALLPRS